MKIIKKGNYNFPMRIKCKLIEDEYGFGYGNAIDFCGSELEIEAKDICKHPWSKYPDYSGTDYGVVCPVCNKFIYIDKSKLPQIVLDNAKEISVE